MLVCVLKGNKAKGFYQKYGAEFLKAGRDTFGGQELDEEYYGWENLRAFLGK